jgi:hypothetical protein
MIITKSGRFVVYEFKIFETRKLDWNKESEEMTQDKIIKLQSVFLKLKV